LQLGICDVIISGDGQICLEATDREQQDGIETEKGCHLPLYRGHDICDALPLVFLHFL
jgi:hypothetical protein